MLQQKDVKNVSEENLNIGHKFLMGLVLFLVKSCYINVILYFPLRARQVEIQKYILKKKTHTQNQFSRIADEFSLWHVDGQS